VKDAASRLRLLRCIGFPAELFQGVSQKLIDHLVDLLVGTVHKIGKGAENKIDGSLEKVVQKKTSGKIAKLYRMAKASVCEPGLY